MINFLIRINGIVDLKKLIIGYHLNLNRLLLFISIGITLDLIIKVLYYSSIFFNEKVKIMDVKPYKFVIIPDSFKGSLSSIEISNIIEEQIKSIFSNANIIKIPIADGGEGTVDSFLQFGGRKVNVTVNNPYFEKMDAFYGLIENDNTAVIEMAVCCGLPLVENRKDPSLTSTYGVGQLIKDALEKGVNKIILGLGGSCTNDGGTGCLAALGVKFYNANNEAFIPVGGTLENIKGIDIANLDDRLKAVELITMCDIDNPLYGKDGAAYIFSPQKGANSKMVEYLDYNLKQFVRIVNDEFGFANWSFPGAGAAGGMGFGIKAFLNSKIQMGIDTILDIVKFDKIIEDVDLIFTGEGKLDSQSLRGKVVIGVARSAKKQNKKVVAIVGVLEESGKEALNEGVSEIIVTNYKKLPFEKAKLRAKEDMIYVLNKYLSELDCKS